MIGIKVEPVSRDVRYRVIVPITEWEEGDLLRDAPLLLELTEAEVNELIEALENALAGVL